VIQHQKPSEPKLSSHELIGTVQTFSKVDSFLKRFSSDLKAQKCSCSARPLGSGLPTFSITYDSCLNSKWQKQWYGLQSRSFDRFYRTGW